jgi:hypothetical protein
MAIHILAMVTSSWSIIYILIAALRVQNGPEGGAGDETGEISYTIRQDPVIAISSIGLFSSMYHSIMAERCVKNDD